jgi:hypothetical protein
MFGKPVVGGFRFLTALRLPELILAMIDVALSV